LAGEPLHEGRIELAAPPGTPGQDRDPGKVRGVRLQGGRVSVDGAGEGHDFQPCSRAQPTWCDLCGEFIWGVYKQRRLVCLHCRLTCHRRCHVFVRLDCSVRRSQLGPWEDVVEADTNVDELVDWRTQEMSFAQVHQKVKEYNAQVCSDLHMVLNPDGSFTGFIEVRIKLVRPVCILFAHRAPATGLRCRTSLHLPRDMGKQLHVSSSTRAHDIVQALLSNVGVLDDPGTFALFERSERDGQVHLRRLADTERPLLLRLCVGPSETDMSLVLKEKSDVNWEAFSEPELHNFLRMLQREEEEHVKRVAERYARVRDRLQGALAQSTKT
uniref:Ras association domain family member 1 n=1 Tax=Scleropages formosus TaxID=113540 RepID=A0A8C9RBD2_SCLFO